jgi:hypothetical protein
MSFRKLLWVVAALLFPLLAFAEAPGLDGRFVALAHQVRGFGGFYFDANGDLNVYLTDLSQERAARAALQDVVKTRGQRRDQPWTRPAEIIVRKGDFDAAQLDAFRTRFTSAPGLLKGVTMIDLDETTNRLVIGVAEEGAKANVLARLDAIGVPQAAVVTKAVPEVQMITTLDDYVRPVVGGLRIDMNINNSPSYCTMGVNVWYSNLAVGVPVGTPGFYTASHCSNTQYTTEGTVYSQGGSRIGYEMYDPPTFTNAQNTRCPAGYPCRWSDVTFAAYDSGVSRHQGYLAQTTYRGFNNWNAGSTTINSSLPEFQIVGGWPPSVGTYLDKVGRTTGWTTGQVSATCADYYAGGSYSLCQDQVEAFADGGDSGSPVFHFNGGSSVSFSGIVWGKTFTGAFIFSNTDRIAADFGNGVTYTP